MCNHRFGNSCTHRANRGGIHHRKRPDHRNSLFNMVTSYVLFPLDFTLVRTWNRPHPILHPCMRQFRWRFRSTCLDHYQPTTEHRSHSAHRCLWDYGRRNSMCLHCTDFDNRVSSICDDINPRNICNYHDFNRCVNPRDTIQCDTCLSTNSLQTIGDKIKNQLRWS